MYAPPTTSRESRFSRKSADETVPGLNMPPERSASSSGDNRRCVSYARLRLGVGEGPGFLGSTRKANLIEEDGSGPRTPKKTRASGGSPTSSIARTAR